MATSRLDIGSAVDRELFVAGRGHLLGVPHNSTVANATTGVPVNGTVGFAPGALFHNHKGSAGTALYVNVGTVTSSTWVPLDLATIGNLARPEINTADTTVGAATLTAAAIAGGLITRSGSTADYTDTTATAALIIAALPTGTAVGASWELTIKNTVAFVQTLVGGTSVTLTGQTIIPPNSAGKFLMTYNGAGTVTMVGVQIVPLTSNALEISTALSTVGAGTITAAGIVGGVTNRTGSTAAFTDTTATAALIIAAMPNANIGQSFEYTYYNNTLGVATITGGTGVTVSKATVVPQCCWARFLVTYTAASTITMVGIATGMNVELPNAQFTTAALSSTTASAGQLSGAKWVTMENTGANPGTYTTRTATLMFGDIPNCQIGFTYMLRISNGQGTGTLTLAGGTGVTITGTATIAANVYRDFLVTINTTTTLTMQNIGSGTAP